MTALHATKPPWPVCERAEYNGLDAMPNWIDPFVGTPEERIAKLKQPGMRDRMRQDVGAWTGTGGQADVVSNWAKMRVVEVRHPRNYQYEGMTVAELADATGNHPIDAILDLAIDEELRTEVSTHPPNGTDPRAVAKSPDHPILHPCV